MTDARTLKSVRIFVGGSELETIGDPMFSIPPDPGAALADFKRPEPGNFNFTAKCELVIPADIRKLRSVSPAAKKAFARQRWALTFDAWISKATEGGNQ